MTAENGRRSPSRPWRLRTRLALALLLVLGPVAALLTYTHIEDLRDRRNSKIESFEAISQTVAASMDGFARDLESFTLSTSITLGTVASTATFEQSTAGPYLQRLLDSYGSLRAVFITDLDGKVLVSNSGESNGFDLSSRSYVQDLKRGRESVWSGALAGAQSGQTTMAHGRVIRALDGRPYYYLIVAFYPEQLAKRLPKDLPPDANISLIDDNGVILFSTLPMENQRESIADSALFQKAKGGQTALLRDEPSPILGDRRYGAFVPVNSNGWVVGYTRPVAAVDGPLNSRIQRDLAVIFVLLIGGFVLIIAISTRLSRPLTQLARVAADIARGEHPLVPQPSADADVRKLEDAMTTMARAVAEREERLLAQANILETLDRVGDSLATELDYQKAVSSVSRAALGLTHSDSVVLFYKPPDKPEESFESITSTAHAGPDPAASPISYDDPLLKKVFEGEAVNAQDVVFMPGQPRTRLIAEDGSASVRSLLGIPVISRTGQIHGALVLLHSKPGWYTDEHHRLASGLARRASIVLENAWLYGESQAVQDELRSANVAKDEFIGVMSHELRTPITTIYGGARLLHARRRHLAESDVDEMIESIEDEAERLYRLVENLLALARIDLGTEVSSDPVAVGPVVEQVVKQFTSRHPGRPVETNAKPAMPLARGESTYLHQILHNLITNADKYSESGLPIEVNVDYDEAAITIGVSDHGKGVAPGELDQIFESFYRSQRTAREARGKGLGLTVCKRLVEAMGGQIWAKNAEGGGLVVTFTLMIAEDPERLLESAAPEAATAAS